MCNVSRCRLDRHDGVEPSRETCDALCASGFDSQAKTLIKLKCEFMLIENRIKRRIEYEKTDREDKDESFAQGIERERSGLSNQRVTGFS